MFKKTLLSTILTISTLATAQIHFLRFVGCECKWLKPGVLVRTVAIRLLLAAAADTPIIGATRLDIDGVWRLLGRNRFSHDPVSSVVGGPRRPDPAGPRTLVKRQTLHKTRQSAIPLAADAEKCA